MRVVGMFPFFQLLDSVCSICRKDCVDLTEKYVSKEIEMKRSDEKPAYTSKHAISLLILVKLFVSTVTGNSKIA
jgi:hypothetical protein